MKFNLPGGFEVLRGEQAPVQKKPAEVPTVEVDLVQAPAEEEPPKPKRGRKPKKTEIVD